jgi:hypothetical protein
MSVLVWHKQRIARGIADERWIGRFGYWVKPFAERILTTERKKLQPLSFEPNNWPIFVFVTESTFMVFRSFCLVSSTASFITKTTANYPTQ